MKANELMIGDFCESFVDKEIVRIECLTIDYPEVTYLNVDMPNGMILQHNYTQLTPIPLTSEILEKNGWLNGPYSRLQLQDGKWLEFYWHEHRLQEYWSGIDEWQNHSKQLELVFKVGCIHYVHELQHALRLCRLNDLADNFKV